MSYFYPQGEVLLFKQAEFFKMHPHRWIEFRTWRKLHCVLWSQRKQFHDFSCRRNRQTQSTSCFLASSTIFSVNYGWDHVCNSKHPICLHSGDDFCNQTCFLSFETTYALICIFIKMAQEKWAKMALNGAKSLQASTEKILKVDF